MIPIRQNWPLLPSISAAVMSFCLMLRLHRGQWRPSLSRLRKGVWLSIHPWTCIRVAKAFMTTGTQPIVQVDPRVMFKYVGNYVSLDLSPQEGASILIDHYGFLRERVKRNFFPAIIDGRLVLWRQIMGAKCYRISMVCPRNTDGEGDLSLFSKRIMSMSAPFHSPSGQDGLRVWRVARSILLPVPS